LAWSQRRRLTPGVLLIARVKVSLTDFFALLFILTEASFNMIKRMPDKEFQQFSDKEKNALMPSSQIGTDLIEADTRAGRE
jgi:hypothetical protein